MLFVLLTRVAYADSVEVEGILVVSGCQRASYRQISLTEPENLEIGTACAKRGVPLTLLVGAGDRGELYTLVAPSPLLAEHLTKKTRMKGQEIAPQVVIPEKLEIKTGASWEEVATTTMM